MTFNISKKDVEERLSSIKIQRQKLDKSVSIFNDDWGVKIHPNSLFIFNAGSGVGKTTWVRQCVKECIRFKRKSLIFSNEELKSSIEQQILDSFRKEYPKMSEEEILERVLNYCYIIDLEDTDELEYYDKVPGLIIAAMEDFRPDIIFFDNITYCTMTEGNDRRKAYDYLPEMVKEFKPLVISEKDYPPIVLIQQGYSVPGALAGESNKDASNTVQPCTHVVQSFRDGKYTILEVQKYRYSGDSGYKRYTKFSYDSYTDNFEFVEEMDDYTPKKQKKRDGAF